MERNWLSRFIDRAGNNPYMRMGAIVMFFGMWFVMIMFFVSVGAYMVEDGWKWDNKVRARHDWGANVHVVDTRPLWKTFEAFGGIMWIAVTLGGSAVILIGQVRGRNTPLKCKLRAEGEIICNQFQERSLKRLPARVVDD